MSVRNYIVQLARELYDMGFDEVVLADVAHPTFSEPTELIYTDALHRAQHLHRGVRLRHLRRKSAQRQDGASVHLLRFKARARQG